MARRYSAISGQTCTDQVLPSHGYGFVRCTTIRPRIQRIALRYGGCLSVVTRCGLRSVTSTSRRRKRRAACLSRCSLRMESRSRGAPISHPPLERAGIEFRRSLVGPHATARLPRAEPQLGADNPPTHGEQDDVGWVQEVGERATQPPMRAANAARRARAASASAVAEAPSVLPVARAARPCATRKRHPGVELTPRASI